MAPETPLQYNFTGDLVDNRTHRQKQLARQANGWQQPPMFAQRQLAQFGVRAHPEMPAIARNGKRLEMVLEIEDPRTEDEKALAQQRVAEEKTYPLFSPDGKKEPTQSEGRATVAELEGRLLTLGQKRKELLELLAELLEREAATIKELQSRDAKTRPLRLPEEIGQTHHIFGPGFHLQRSVQIFPLPSGKEL